MLDMTNDSGLFRTAEQLESEGFYPVEENRWKRGDELCLPAYTKAKWYRRLITGPPA